MLPRVARSAAGLLGWWPVPGNCFASLAVAASLPHLPGFLCHLPGVIALSDWQENPWPGVSGNRKAKAAAEEIPVRQVWAAPASRCLPCRPP